MTSGQHKASVTIDARVDAADRDIKKLTRRINGMEKELSRTSKSALANSESLKKVGRMGAYTATAAAGAAVALFKLAEASAETANVTAKAAKGLGVAADGLQKLEFATSRATTATSEQLHKAIAVLTVGLQDAAVKGTGPVAEGLKAIGLQASDLDGLSIDAKFEKLARAIQTVPDANDQAAVSMKLFGQRAGAALAPLLKEGPAALKAYGEEAKRLGLVLDDKALKASEDFVDSLSDMKQTVAAVARDVGIKAIPAFKDAADGVKEWTVENQELIDQKLPQLIDQMTTGMTALATAVLSVSSALGDMKDGFEAAKEFIRKNPLFGNPTLTANEERMARLDRRRAASVANGGEYESVRRRVGPDGNVIEYATPQDMGGFGASDASISDAEAARLAAEQRIAQHNYLARQKKNKKKPKGRGGKRDNKSLLEGMLEKDQQALNAFSDDIPDTSFLDSGLADPFSPENQQVYLDEMARLAEEERQIAKARNDGLLQDELASLEMRRELGVDPIVLIEQEQQARLEHNDFLLEQASSEAEILRLQNERRGIYHDAEMKRLQVERQHQEKRLQVFSEVGQGIDTVYRATAEAALASAFAQGQSVREAVRGTAKAEAMRSAITAGSAFVQAAFWAAVPGGQATAAAFVTAGAIATAKAAAFGAIAGGLGAGGGRGGRGGGPSGAFTGASFGGGASTGGATLPSSGPSSPPALPGSTSDVPGSPTGTPGGQTNSSTRSNSGEPPISFQGATFHLYGAGGPDDFIESVSRGQERLRLKRRR